MKPQILLFFLVLMLVGPKAFSTSIQVLDSNFFDEGPNLRPYGGVQVLNPNFFKNQKSLKTVAPGREGTIAVASNTPGGEASAITNVTDRYCDGPATTTVVPNPYLYNYGAYGGYGYGSGLYGSQSNVPRQYYLVKCKRRDDSGNSRRRPGPR